MLASTALIFAISLFGKNKIIIGAVIFGLGVSAVITLIFSRYMPAKTIKGVEAREYLLGLRDYITLAEKDRLKYLQSPEGSEKYGNPAEKSSKVKLFENLLPYAMIFGLEKDWAKQFDGVYDRPPDWLRGNTTNFNSLYLATTVSDFSSASSTSFTPPTSSSTSGFSGGGGFSGGDGGGGGGGGW